MYYTSITDANGNVFPIAVNIAGYGAPTVDGSAGMFYVDLKSDDIYKCLGGTNWTKVKLGGDSADTSALEARIEEVERKMDDLVYEEISITSFGHDAGTKEYGATVNSVNLSWAINKTPTALTLDGVSINVWDRSKFLTGLSITKDSNKTWVLVATDDRGATSQKTTSISFCNGVYYGAAAAPANYDSAFVRGLTKELRDDKKPSFTVTAGAGQYIYYCLPVRMGTCTFKVGGFEGGFELVKTLSFTNASGYTENYYIYKSVNANLGNTTVTVS